MRMIYMMLGVLALILAACSPAAGTQPAPVIGEPQIPESEAPRLGLEEAKTAFDEGSAVFLDVRSTTAYAESHIPGALSIPLSELEARMGELDPGQWIVTYCT